jgi:ADP-ribose pyrophosphatase YjhB (NUDIX family)
MTRVDHFNEPGAPEANSIVIAVSAFVQDDSDRILMIRRTDNDLYALPGGRHELGETMTETAVRETREETGFTIGVDGLVGIYSNPHHVMSYDDGEVRQEFSICFRGHVIGGRARASSESSEVVWVEPGDLGAIQVHPSIRLRIDHALSGGAPFYT